MPADATSKASSLPLENSFPIASYPLNNMSALPLRPWQRQKFICSPLSISVVQSPVIFNAVKASDLYLSSLRILYARIRVREIPAAPWHHEMGNFKVFVSIFFDDFTPLKSGQLFFFLLYQ